MSFQGNWEGLNLTITINPAQVNCKISSKELCLWLNVQGTFFQLYHRNDSLYADIFIFFSMKKHFILW